MKLLHNSFLVSSVLLDLIWKPNILQYIMCLQKHGQFWSQTDTAASKILDCTCLAAFQILDLSRSLLPTHQHDNWRDNTLQCMHINADIWQRLLTYITVGSRNSALLKASFSVYPSPKGSLRKFIMCFQPSPPLKVDSVVVAAYSTLGCSCLNYRLFVGSCLVGSNL